MLDKNLDSWLPLIKRQPAWINPLCLISSSHFPHTPPTCSLSSFLVHSLSESRTWSTLFRVTCVDPEDIWVWKSGLNFLWIIANEFEFWSFMRLRFFPNSYQITPSCVVWSSHAPFQATLQRVIQVTKYIYLKLHLICLCTNNCNMPSHSKINLSVGRGRIIT